MRNECQSDSASFSSAGKTKFGRKAAYWSARSSWFKMALYTMSAILSLKTGSAVATHSTNSGPDSRITSSKTRWMSLRTDGSSGWRSWWINPIPPFCAARTLCMRVMKMATRACRGMEVMKETLES